MAGINLTAIGTARWCMSVPPIKSHPPCSTNSFIRAAPCRGWISHSVEGIHWYESTFGNFRCCFSESYPRCHSYSREPAHPANPAKASASSFVAADVFVELERGLCFHCPSDHASGEQDAVWRSGTTVVVNTGKSSTRNVEERENRVKASVSTTLRPITGLTERKREFIRKPADPKQSKL